MSNKPSEAARRLIQSLTHSSAKLQPYLDLRDRIKRSYSPRSRFNRWRNSDEGKDWKQQQLKMINNVCPICNKQKYPEDFVIDHINPLSKGGHPTQVTNLRLLCGYCNSTR